jgi:hypothetical protein
MMLHVDAALFGLFGVIAGGLITLVATVLGQLTTEWAARRHFREELRVRRAEEVRAQLDTCAVALERVQWALRRALDAHFRSSSPERSEWSQLRQEVDRAREAAATEGSRLAIRIGTHKDVLDKYNDEQEEYRDLAAELVLYDWVDDTHRATFDERLRDRAWATTYLEAANVALEYVIAGLPAPDAKARWTPRPS